MATSNKRIGETVRLVNVRLAFPHLFEAHASSATDTPKFSANFIFAPDHPAFAEVQKAIIKVAKEKWGDEGLAIAKALLPKDQTCLRDGTEKGIKYEGFSGNWFVSASNKTRPTVVHRVKDPATGKPKVLTEKDGVIYAGSYVNALIEVYPMEAKGEIKRGIHATLMGVQFAGDGDAFGGGRIASEDDFEALDTDESSDAPWAEDTAESLV